MTGNLPRLLTQDHHVGVDESECVNDDLALHTLDWIYHDGDGTVYQDRIVFWYTMDNTMFAKNV